jgi:hypothetical protein
MPGVLIVSWAKAHHLDVAPNKPVFKPGYVRPHAEQLERSHGGRERD